MNDYDFHKDILKPTKIYNQPTSPRYANNNKVNTYSTSSKSNQKHIITSFTKKITTPKKVEKHLSKDNERIGINRDSIQSPSIKKSHCQSEYYVHKTENKPSFQAAKYQDGLKVKDIHIQDLSVKLNKAETLIKRLQAENYIKNQRIQKLQSQIHTLLTKALKGEEIDRLGSDLLFQCQKYKNDQKRLLKMLQGTSQYELFARFALIDEGIQFLRIPHEIKKDSTENIELNPKTRKTMHFCSCNKDLIAETNFWVPQKIYNYGKEFIKERKGDLTISEYQLLLYELNRIWRDRQKKIIKSLNIQKIRQIQKIKRISSSGYSSEKKSLNK